MKIIHRDCGGEVLESKTIPPYKSEEYEVVPAIECNKCGNELLGDMQIEFVAESLADTIQVDALEDSRNYYENS